MNNDMVRQGLMAVLDSSNADDPNPANRHERAFLVVQDTLTPGSKPYIFILPKHPWADVCDPGLIDMPDIPFAGTLQGHKILAHGHDHPSPPNAMVGPCTDATGNTIKDRDGVPLQFPAADGPSIEDWEWMDRVNSPTENPAYHVKGWLPMPSMVMDKLRLMMMRPGSTSGSEKAPGNTFHWKYGKCAWPKRTI